MSQDGRTLTSWGLGLPPACLGIQCSLSCVFASSAVLADSAHLLRGWNPSVLSLLWVLCLEPGLAHSRCPRESGERRVPFPSREEAEAPGAWSRGTGTSGSAALLHALSPEF